MTESAPTQSEQPKKKFAPKTPVQLDPPKDDPISTAHLSKCDGRITSCFLHAYLHEAAFS